MTTPAQFLAQQHHLNAIAIYNLYIMPGWVYFTKMTAFSSSPIPHTTI